MSEIVRLENLSFRYAEGTVPALSDISLGVQAGEFIGITGPAGAGKTTLLSCINGVIPHYYSGELHGRVVVDGLEVGSSTFRELASHIGSAFEDPDFQMVSITVEEEIAFGPENLGVPRPAGLVKIWRETHPTLGERIDFANSYHPWKTGAAGKYEHLFRDK